MVITMFDRRVTTSAPDTTGALLEAGLVAMGLGWATVVGLDGSPFWRVGRIIAVAALFTGSISVVRRGSTHAIGLVAITLGLIGVAAGTAITLPWLRTDGISMKAASALVAAGASALLLAVGALVVIRCVTGWRRLLAVPVAAVLVYAVAAPVAIAVFATNVPRPSLGRETPADRGLRYLDAAFVTSDGVTLSGWYLPSTNGAAVVLLHGASSTRSAVLDQAVALARHGYGVLLFDARGMGRSGGRAMNFGWYGDRDVSAAVDYLARRPEVDPARIGALGESMGGEEAIGAMAADARLRAVVAEGATNRVAGDTAWLSGAHGLRGSVQRAINWLTYTLADLLTDAPAPATLRASAVAAAPRPILLIAAGTVDDERAAGTWIRDGSPGNVELWVVPGAAHTGGLHAQPAEWDQQVSAFSDRALA